MPNKPRIFLFHMELEADEGLTLDAYYACAEDGTRLAGVGLMPSERIFAHQRLTGPSARRKYDAHYPDGYVIVDLLNLTDEEQATHPDLNAALERGIKANEQE